MSVSREKQLFKCFSCGAGGNVFQFVKEIENITFLEAVSKVASKVGINFTYNQSFQPVEKFEQEYKIMDLTKMFYHNNLKSKEAKEARDYLAKRKIDNEIIDNFGLGFAFKGNQLLELLKAKKYDITKLKDLSLVSQKENQYYDMFQNRILFPIENPSGKVVGFTARTINPNDTPKYLNSRESIIFKKGEILYNYHRARENVRLLKKIIIVEGNMDAIRMSACGFPNTIALMGTSLTKEQIELIRKLRVPITLMLDNDNAGLINTYQNGLLLEQAKLDVWVVRLSKVKDPDEYLLNFGSEAMQDALDHPLSFLEFKLMYLKENRNLQDSADLILYIKDVIKSLENYDDLTKKMTLQKIANDYSISYEILNSELQKAQETNNQPLIEVKPINKPKDVIDNYSKCANPILYYMMNDSKYINIYLNRLGYFSEKKYRQIASEILYYYEKNKTINLADFLSYAELSPVKDDIFQVIGGIKDEEISETNMVEYITMLQTLMINQDIFTLRSRQRQTFDINEKIAIGIKITELHRKKEELKKERSVEK